ncbi:hypothetical protein NPIL_473601 [Nephila pilipes]|uniref:Uncharacterized protein n=1 Tax=Nephila pilipes TaxID=299642 RepID=A0A8X6N1W5_NEPPI|nr:hypothetical protein NPIL_473601 [Nephila pilipes]
MQSFSSTPSLIIIIFLCSIGEDCLLSLQLFLPTLADVLNVWGILKIHLRSVPPPLNATGSIALETSLPRIIRLAEKTTFRMKLDSSANLTHRLLVIDVILVAILYCTLKVVGFCLSGKSAH